MRGTHLSPMDSPTTGLILLRIVFFLFTTWTRRWTNSWVAGDIDKKLATHVTPLSCSAKCEGYTFTHASTIYICRFHKDHTRVMCIDISYYSCRRCPGCFPGNPVEFQWGSRRYPGRLRQAGVIGCHMMLPGQNVLTLTHLEPSCMQ